MAFCSKMRDPLAEKQSHQHVSFLSFSDICLQKKKKQECENTDLFPSFMSIGMRLDPRKTRQFFCLLVPFIGNRTAKFSSVKFF